MAGAGHASDGGIEEWKRVRSTCWPIAGSWRGKCAGYQGINITRNINRVTSEYFRVRVNGSLEFLPMPRERAQPSLSDASLSINTVSKFASSEDVVLLAKSDI